MSYEMKKATERRMRDADFWSQVFQGDGIDVGCGPDKMEWPGANVVPFDKEQGDGGRLNDYFPADRFDFVVSSQFVEHTDKPVQTLQNMITVTRPGGWIVATVPEFLIYEGGKMPSRWNGDHRGSFSLLTKTGAPGWPHLFVPDLRTMLQPHEVWASLQCEGWDFMDQTGKDQTWDFEDLIEAFIEIVIRKAQ